jgi:putative hydrolase of the HAD superfamily
MTVQAVIFDMGGTIETFWHNRELRLAATPAIQQYLVEAGIDLQLSNDQLYEVIAGGLECYKRWSVHSMIELPASQIWNEYVFSGLGVDQDRIAAIGEGLMVLVESRYYQRAMRPEVPAVLQAIREMGLKIGLISNISSLGFVPENLKNYGIIDYFNPVVLSSQYGRRKPDPAIFHYAARLAGVPASACVYVGDRVRRDIEGARRAGYAAAVQIRHNFQHGENDDGPTPDALIEDMTGLLDFLKAPGRERPVPEGKVRALIFDAGDVLYYRPRHARKFSAFLHELEIEHSPQHARERKAVEYRAYRGHVSQEAYREAVVRVYGITDPGQVARGMQALADDNDNVVFFEGVRETLLALKERGYLLGIVTDTANSISAKLSWFERGGFGHVWDSIISSMELGTRKPDARIYQAALHQLGVTPEQAAFVGHHTAELAGARAVGMQTIAFNYDKDSQADCYIEKFADLLKILAVKG